MAKYSVITGQFPCHTCKEIVNSLRSYYDTSTITWMCSQKHLTRVELIHRREK